MMEVQGRIVVADTVALCKNEILAVLGKLGCWLLAIIEIDGATAHATSQCRPALQTLAFAVTSTTFEKECLMASAVVVLERTDTWQ